MVENKEKGSNGRKQNQKMKPYLTYYILMKKTDTEHSMTADDVCAELDDQYGVSAERRSIYTDIDQINKTLLAIDKGISLKDAGKLIAQHESYKTIHFDKHKELHPTHKGFYVSQRQFEIEDLHLLAECVYTAKFISEKTANHLLGIIGQFLSEHQAKKFKYDAVMVGRQRTENDNVYYNVLTINDAMSKRLYDETHKPEKISFKYLEHTIGNVNRQVERGRGKKYVVSPYQIVINDGNYYLLAFDDQSKKIKTYRIDRMKDVDLQGDPRDGEDEFKKIDMKNYTKRSFSMYSGKTQKITLQCINPLLDTMIEKFGRRGVTYTKVDDRHFNVETTVDVSNQFYGWLLGFGKKARLISPEDTVAEFKNYIDKIREMY